MFSKILIANRGEIAVRCIRACRNLGIRAAVIYHEIDRSSLAVRLADEAYQIEAVQPREAYLNIGKIIDIAQTCQAQAIHPGYGFLAENAQFAAACGEKGITFIGPPPEVIDKLGDKNKARALMHRLGLPLVPGTPRPVTDLEEAVHSAQKLGYPLLLKASGGGGGRGMRLVHNEEELKLRFPQARSEALAAFGSPAIYLERYLQWPRHVEVQILADNHGKAIHLLERECSIQRRFQKLLEEAPSPAVDAKLRKALGESAVKGALEAGYVGAGTFEFLLDRSGQFYFLEVNTRLQVEHPITEEITGIDLVEQQIKIASGEPLALNQEMIVPQGWALECRVTCEDPSNNFLPVPGPIGEVRYPAGPGIRVDSHLYSGYTIPADFDSLIAKLIAHGRNRNQAIRRMLTALYEFKIAGIPTTIPFHRKLLTDEDFQKGKLSTHFLEEHPELLSFPIDDHQSSMSALIAALELVSRQPQVACEVPETDEAALWRQAGRQALMR